MNCEQILLRPSYPDIKLTPDLAPEFHYPLYPLQSNEILESQSTPQKKMFFLQNRTPSSPRTDQLPSTSYTNLTDNKKNVLINSPLSSVECSTESDIPDVRKVPDYMNIPNLWNVQLVQPEPDEKSQSKDEVQREGSGSGSGSSDWEFL